MEQCFFALSTEGKILLPINKDEHKQKLTEQTMNERKKWIDRC